MKNFHFITNNVQVFTKRINWRKVRKILIIVCIIILGLISTCKKLNAQQINYYDFTNQNYTINQVSKFIKSFENNKLTDKQIYFIYWQCQAFKINPLITLSVMEKESSLVSNPEEIGRYNWREHRAMGYGLIYATWAPQGKFYLFGHFPIQVHSGVKCLRKWFDWYFELVENEPYDDVDMKINNGNKNVNVKNGIDYTLFKYTPFLESRNNFYKIYRKFKRRWSIINE